MKRSVMKLSLSTYRGDFNLLKYFILSDVAEVIPGYLSSPGFCGRVVIEIPETSPKFTLGQCQELVKFEAQLNNLARQDGWVTSSCECVEIRLHYSQRRRAERGIKTSVLNLLQGV